MNNKVYVTTTIPYVNARPHIGFALELVQADAVARYHRLLGHEVRLQTGTDENAFKNVLAAREHHVPAQQWVDQHSQAFHKLCLSLNISVDDFIRTTEPRTGAGSTGYGNSFAPGTFIGAATGDCTAMVARIFSRRRNW